MIFFPFSSFSSDASFLQAPRRPYFSRSVSTNTIIVERSEEEEEEDEDVIVLVEEDEDDDDVSRSLSISISFLFFGSFLRLGHSLVLTIVFSGSVSTACYPFATWIPTPSHRPSPSSSRVRPSQTTRPGIGQRRGRGGRGSRRGTHGSAQEGIQEEDQEGWNCQGESFILSED